MSETDPVLASLDPSHERYIEVGEMKMLTVDDQRLAVVRTDDGVFALDNACPHQGYGLVTGELGVDGEGEPVVTCLWHNWKFRVRDGVCVIGEENVACHPTSVSADGDVHVSIQRPTKAEQLEVLWPSLRSALRNNYVGQLSRDTVRLLDNGATPAEIMAVAIDATIAMTEDGADHEMALAADCLAIAEERNGDDRVLPLVIGLSGLSEQTRGREPMEVAPADRGDVVELIESEDLVGAMATVGTMTSLDARPKLVEAASRHHLGYGHGSIYAQKTFELLDRIGEDSAAALLPQLTRSLTLMTREDVLPYMRKTTSAIDDVDLDALASTTRTDPSMPDSIIAEYLDANAPGIGRAVELAADGLGVEGLIDIASLGSARRMLRYDLANERDAQSNFNWLSITHGLTHARATRWAWNNHPGPHAARMALHGLWLLFDTGRLERRTAPQPIDDRDGDVVTSDPVGFADELLDEAMDDRGGSFIVVAHLVKTVRAALEETQATDSALPLLAAARLIRGERRERFVARNVNESIRFVRTGRPPQR